MFSEMLNVFFIFHQYNFDKIFSFHGLQECFENLVNKRKSMSMLVEKPNNLKKINIIKFLKLCTFH